MTPVQFAWEGLSNAMRLYVEGKLRFDNLFQVDREEAVNNMDRAMEAKLEKFHSLYDVTKDLPGFEFFAHGDTSLLIVLRNALHHRDHSLFQSWNARLGLNDGMHLLSGTEFLLASTTPGEAGHTVRFYYPLHDFYARLGAPRISNPTAMKALWDAELLFDEMASEGRRARYPDDRVYVDVMPAFMSAIARVRTWLDATGFQPAGYDGKTYFEHFADLDLPQSLGYKRLRLP
ncbi:hypothetical protein [Mitsuaria sp. 7]|uniref:hypothetical protein n=1 Tax=Mitsuaria sp. 7 TaxID=1658665 RepID=UPI0007DDA8A2|nr:hypothetical protein [Mitsuaria sp. 7]ANH66642.1 hypothetical protein ABE85_02015 [Mitsuaria sp. 7]